MSSEVTDRRRRVMIRLIGTALVWSVGLIVAAVLLPTYDGQTVTNANGVTLTSSTFVAVNGAWSLIPVSMPAIACVVVAVAIHRRWRWIAVAAVGLLTALSLLAILSIGVFVLPVVVLLAFAVSLAPPAAASGAHPVHG